MTIIFCVYKKNDFFVFNFKFFIYVPIFGRMSTGICSFKKKIFSLYYFFLFSIFCLDFLFFFYRLVNKKKIVACSAIHFLKEKKIFSKYSESKFGYSRIGNQENWKNKRNKNDFFWKYCFLISFVFIFKFWNFAFLYKNYYQKKWKENWLKLIFLWFHWKIK